MTDKKEVNILLLGIVAILAIVGLVLLFTSPAATGKAFFPPALPPSVENPAPISYGGGAVVIPSLEGSNLPVCPNGRARTREMGNIPYQAIPGHLCSWFFCPQLEGSDDPAAKPMLACVKA